MAPARVCPLAGPVPARDPSETPVPARDNKEALFFYKTMDPALLTAIAAACVAIITQIQHSRCSEIRLSDCLYIKREVPADA